MSLNISILTPEREIFHGAIVSVTLPGTKGKFQVLVNHAPIVSSLEKGKVQLVTDGGEYSFFNEETGSIEVSSKAGETIKFQIEGGFVEVLNNQISLLVRGVKNGL
jgi:F-type H+-transporting ATPase subunit epsilon